MEILLAVLAGTAVWFAVLYGVIRYATENAIRAVLKNDVVKPQISFRER